MLLLIRLLSLTSVLMVFTAGVYFQRDDYFGAVLAVAIAFACRVAVESCDEQCS